MARHPRSGRRQGRRPRTASWAGHLPAALALALALSPLRAQDPTVFLSAITVGGRIVGAVGVSGAASALRDEEIAQVASVALEINTASK